MQQRSTDVPRRAVVAAALALLVIVASSRGGSVTSVVPDKGTILTEVAIDGDGFGTRKPRVFLTTGESRKRYRLKVLDFTDTHIDAAVRKAKAGTYDVTVAVKGGDPIVAEDAFMVLPPVIDTVDPPQAGPGDDVTLIGRYFGKKGRVRIGGKKAKMLDWMRSPVPGGDDRATVRMPKKLADGVYDVSLKNKVETANKAASVTMVGSSVGGGGGKKSFTARVDGKAFSGNKRFSFWLDSFGGPNGTIILAGHDGPNLTRGKVINIEVVFDPSTDGVPAVFDNAEISYGEFDDRTEKDFLNADLWVGRGSLTITSNANGVLGGTFSGVLDRFQGDGPPQVAITNGKFSGLGEDK